MLHTGNHFNLQDDGTIMNIMRPAQYAHANEAPGVLEEVRNGLVCLAYPGPDLFQPCRE